LNDSEQQPCALTQDPPRVDVLGVGISCLTLESSVAQVARWVAEGKRHYVCVTGVHGVMESQRDVELKRIHNSSGMTTPDGMPMVWCARLARQRHVSRVYGPDLMLAVLSRACAEGWGSFFYGGGPGIAEQLARRLADRFPGLVVAGTYAPPYRALTPEEDSDIVQRINASGAHLVWVGLGTPKQERWMVSHVHRLQANAVFGVGAAFDIHAGTLAQAPLWMQRSGLEWSYRLAREPRRLWRRYLRNNPAFVARLLRCPPRLIDVGGPTPRQEPADVKPASLRRPSDRRGSPVSGPDDDETAVEATR
jgi:N-acetylglucosaminyldiphosphoundecaprenol N-acetyl-beta-D-mannosaminyltransferase